MKVAFIGLGVMGFPMAGHLASAGQEVSVFNRSPVKCENWVRKFTGRLAKSPADAARGAEVVFACVGNDEDVREITLGRDGVFSVMAEGTVFVDHTTTSAHLAVELADTAYRKKIIYLDAPVSGGQKGAESGELTIMVGGDFKAFVHIRPLLGHYSSMAKLMGPVGTGQLTKMVNQICLTGLLEGLAEGMNFCVRAKLDTGKVLEVLTRGAAGSWQMENRGPTMVQGSFNFGFAVDLMRKDLAFCLEEAKKTGTELPVVEMVDQFYAAVQAMGGGRWDTSSLIARFQKRS